MIKVIINNLIKLNISKKDLIRQSVVLRYYYNGPRTKSTSSSFTQREFVNHTSDGESGTLITRFAKYISINKLCNLNLDNKQIKYADYFPLQNQHTFRQEISKIETNQLSKLVVYSALYRCRSQVFDFVEVLNSIDKECTRRLQSDLAFDDIIKILAAFMYVIPNKIVKLNFYQEALPKLLIEFERNANPDNFIKMIFYMGLYKRNRSGSEYIKSALNLYLDKYLEHDISQMDFAILSNSTFKTSAKIMNSNFNNRLIKELGELNVTSEVDVPLLITYIKSIRLNRIKSTKITETIKTLIMNEKLNELEFKGYTHILAYFADNLVNDPKIIDFLVSNCIKTLDRLHDLMIKDKDEFQDINSEIRPKDLSTLVWACSHLNFDLNAGKNFKTIADILFFKVSNQEYRYCFDELVDTVLSLWILNCKSTDLMNLVFNNREFNKFDNPDKPKIETRKKLLMTCAEIESPKEFSKRSENRKSVLGDIAPDYLIKNRPSLIKVANIIENLSDKYNIKSVKFITQIKYLNIVGIYVEFLSRNDGIHFEILDNSNSLADQVSPMGLFNMKLRLLECQNMNYELVSSVLK